MKMSPTVTPSLEDEQSLATSGQGVFENHRPALARVGNIALESIRSKVSRYGLPLVAVVSLASAHSPAESTPLPSNPTAYTQEQSESEIAPRPVPIGPPFYGPSRLGHTYRSAELRPTANSYDDVVGYYGDAWYHPYPAIDFELPRGRAIRAVTDGVVAISSQETNNNPDAWPRRPGRFILLNPDDPLLPFFAFKHLDSSQVTQGQRVDQGQIIGRAGDTQSPNVHLHFDAHDSVEGFNTYPEQADYGRISFWQCGRRVTLNINNALMDQRINPQPTRTASIRNCNI